MPYSRAHFHVRQNELSSILRFGRKINSAFGRNHPTGPMIALLEAHRAGLFRRGEIRRNIVAGVVVGIVALPLAMAFAIASGAKPEQGL